MTRIAAVLGWPVEHSKSPAIMNAAFADAHMDATMVAMAVPPERFATALAGLRSLPIIGASVTVPHKLAAAALCDELSPAARAIGAVNCLQLDGRRLLGHNTDAQGFVDGLAGAIPKHVVLLGAGGSARAVAYGLAQAGTRVEVVARTPGTITWTHARPWTELAAALAETELVIDCTPTGLTAESDAPFAAAFPFDALRPGARVATLVYHRRPTLLDRAAARGHATFDGRAMLVHQAAHAFAIWTGREPPIAVMTRALDASL